MKTKKCSKCKKFKHVDDFSKVKSKGNKPASYCKSCCSEYARIRRRLKKPYILFKQILNPLGLYRCGKCKIFKTESNFARDKSKSSAISNTCKSCTKEYQLQHRKNKNSHIKKYYKDRYKNNPLFRLRMNLKNRLNSALKRGGFGKSSKTRDIIGCDYGELILYLNTNKYGFKYGDSNLDIDHIIPLSSAITETEIIKLSHYTNLQLLPSGYNRNIKNNNEFNKEHFETWLKNNS